MHASSLELVTWNVWFGALERERRQAALWAELERVAADVVCLQEVVPEHLAGPQFERRALLGDWISDEQLADYDVVMLSRLPVREHERVALPTTMGRSLLVARLDIDPPLTVATVHLDSHEDSTDMRVQQLRVVTKYLADEPDVVLLGDMNFPAEADRPENEPLIGWTDVWPRLRFDDPGYTIDTHINHMRWLLKRKHAQRRIDRVFLRSRNWRPDAIKLLGTESLPDDSMTFVSDHLGLWVRLIGD